MNPRSRVVAVISTLVIAAIVAIGAFAYPIVKALRNFGH
jgi:hypothetical protein